MALRFIKDRTVKWPVKVRTPIDGGRFRDEEFTGEFRILPQSTVDDFDPTTIDRTLLQTALIGWDGLEDEDKTPIPFDEETKAEVLDDPMIRKALIDAYAEAVKGRRPKS
jgi:hypothetical protein